MLEMSNITNMSNLYLIITYSDKRLLLLSVARCFYPPIAGHGWDGRAPALLIDFKSVHPLHKVGQLIYTPLGSREL